MKIGKFFLSVTDVQTVVAFPKNLACEVYDVYICVHPLGMTPQRVTIESWSSDQVQRKLDVFDFKREEFDFLVEKFSHVLDEPVWTLHPEEIEDLWVDVSIREQINDCLSILHTKGDDVDTPRLARIDSLWRSSIKNYVDTGDPVFYGYSQGIDSDHWWFHLDEIASIPDDSFPVSYP
ncbi:hypothetical protein JOD55_000205 [Arcanobacterium pluranimalium]|uniref:hypothetical protein n=1 Tax=Arcanobacterium pluranimalium TaxID=108028 RepID=UPI0019568DD4|nr:hypothetical protein [Arcanobacterium pluranimalium]MBM7824378.1 hypothetical protein [Arcanobacterium pluranimalium]